MSNIVVISDANICIAGIVVQVVVDSDGVVVAGCAIAHITIVDDVVTVVVVKIS